MAQTEQQGKKRKFVLSSCCPEKGYMILSKAPFFNRWLTFDLELRLLFCQRNMYTVSETLYRNVNQPLPQDPVIREHSVIHELYKIYMYCDYG